MIEPEIKLVFASLLLLMWLGDKAHSHAVLPAFVLGLALSNHGLPESVRETPCDRTSLCILML